MISTASARSNAIDPSISRRLISTATSATATAAAPLEHERRLERGPQHLHRRLAVAGG